MTEKSPGLPEPQETRHHQHNIFCIYVIFTEFDHFFPSTNFPLGTVQCCLLELMWVVWTIKLCHPDPVALSVPVWPAHPCTFASTLSFLRASSSEPRQQFHLFCQSWACTQPSLVVFPPAQLDAKPVDFTHMPVFPFLYLYFTLSLCLWPCQCLNQWGRVLRRCHFCGYVILNLLYRVQSKWKLLNDRVLQ